MNRRVIDHGTWKDTVRSPPRPHPGKSILAQQFLEVSDSTQHQGVAGKRVAQNHGEIPGTLAHTSSPAFSLLWGGKLQNGR